MPEASSPPENPEESRYIVSAQRGDLSAFNWLVLQHQTRVYNLCYRMLSDPDAAADATQETFISAYRAISRFKGGSFKSWVLRIAANECLDMLRSRKRSRTQSLDNWEQPGGEEPSEPLPIADLDPSIDPESQTLRSETIETIQQGLDALPEDQRMALVLVDVQGLSYEEAAEVTNTNLGTMKSRINRARARMRDFLRERGVVPSARELSKQE